MKSIQYTIRNVHPDLDSRLREKAVREGRSLNAVLVNALRTGIGLGAEPIRDTEFDDLAGTWVNDEACEAALDSMRESIDPELWR